MDIAIEIGESYYREFKSALEGPPGNKKSRDQKEVCYDIAKTLVAFANADGGELFIGIEDDNTVTGLPYQEEITAQIIKAHEYYILKETPLPIKRATLIDYNGKRIAYFSVEKGAKYVHQTAKGECFQRKDRESVPTSLDAIRLAREEEVSREYDRQFVDLADIDDLDLKLIEAVSQSIFKSMSPEKFLQYLDLAEFDGSRLRLRKAALLLFAKKPSKWHPRSQVRLLRVRGTEEKTGTDFNVNELAEIGGNIFELIDQSWESLRPHLTETRYSEDARFKTQIIYPELACKEALINAITHRDYSLEGRGIEIKIFDDRLEILSPGKLLSSITIKELEELKGVHQSRNTYIARVLREFGYVRELGEGIRRIFELMESSDMVRPKIESPNKSFIVTLFYKFTYTKEEKIWLDNFEPFNLSRDQKTIVRLGINGRPLSAKEIFDQAGIVSEDYYRQLIESLREKGILTNKLTRDEVNCLARQKKVSNKSVPRYEVVVPAGPGKSGGTVSIDDDSDYAKVYVGNIPYSLTESELSEIFGRFGVVSDAVIRKGYDGYSRGYGFVEYERRESAAKALSQQAPIIIKGRRVYVREFLKVPYRPYAQM